MKGTKHLLWLIVLLLNLPLAAQTTFTGTVRLDSSKEPVAGANVLLYSKDGHSLYGYAGTNEAGQYTLLFKGQADSVRVQVTGFSIKTVYRVVPAVSRQLDFNVIFEEMTLREVVVKSEPITRHSDTLNYYVVHYIDSLDRNIGDVLKKMPGIHVEKSGQILYNNKPINKFYIEGLDMMGGRYGIATNSVQAKDIASVQVLESHQPIKALKDIVLSNDAAINLTLKDKAKGALAALVQLGGGFKPWMWNGALAAMQFSANFQMLCTYKTNNSGNDITSEQNSFYGGLEETPRLLAVHTPSTPGTEKERYMDNLTHSVSLNTLIKLKEDHTFTVNGKYIHDWQRFNAASVTTYYLPEEAPLVIREHSAASLLSDEMEVGITLRKNTEQIYLNERFLVGADWNRDKGSVFNATDSIFQQHKLPRVRLKNHFDFTKAIRNVRLSFQSVINAAQLPASLEVTPVIYPELFGLKSATDGTLLQQVLSKKLNSVQSLLASYTFRFRHTFYGNVGFSTDFLGMTSELSHSSSSAPDSLRNDLGWGRIDSYMILGYTFQKGRFTLDLNANFTYMHLAVEDRVRTLKTKMNRLYADPTLRMNLKLSPDLKLTASASLRHQTGASGSTYGGYIMTDYRMITSNDGQVRESLFQNYDATLSYANAIYSVFGSLQASYWWNKSNLMYGTQYFGSLSRIESFALDNIAKGYSIRGRIEKRFDDLSTSVAIPFAFNRSYRDVLRQAQIMKTQYYSIPVGLEVASRFSESVRAAYTLSYQRSKSTIQDNPLQPIPIDGFRQQLDVFVIPFKALSIKCTGEHYFNSTITSGSRSMFFLDASLTYKTKRFEYILEGRNLLNTQSYNNRLYTDITDYEYSYALRPLSILLKVSFTIR